jgi:DNA polymerase-3 subunit alpha
VLLQTKCRDGLKLRLNSSDASAKYIDRLKKELEIIDQMHFNDYFLVVQDYVNFAKRSGILVGPGRGSAAGSLVSYVLGITDIDPIEHNLIFERFLNPERVTMPDIDIDFMDNRRNEIIEYLFNKYGVQRVAHILTFQRMKAKMAIRDAGRILGIELPIINNISKLISYEYDLDLTRAIKENKQVAALATKYEDLFDIAQKFLNYPRQVGLHAAGVVITNNNLDEVLPIQSSTDGMNSTQYSMEYLEPLGLIKMDILGLVNLTTINETLKLIKKKHSIDIDLSKINLKDKAVFDQLTKGDTIGIFQLESPGMRNLIIKIKPKSIEDISITSALFRPGPQKNIPDYLKNKANPEAIQYLNNDFKEVLASTYNIIIYQEQVIQIVQKVANFTLAEADLFRRAISKKNAIKLSQLKEQFIVGGLKNKYSVEELNKIFDFVYEFANYGFNHSHSLAYSYISYWMAYLKVHYPLEYFTILLSTSENSADKVALYVQSARAIGINVLPPSINESEYSFRIDGKKIIIGFNAIRGVGHETITKIINARDTLKSKKFTSYTQAITTLANYGVGIKAVESLVKVGGFDDLLENKSRYYLLTNLTEIYEKSQTTTTDGELLIKPVLTEVQETNEIKAQLDEEQYKLLGISFIEHPLTKIKEAYKGEYQIVNLIDASGSNGEVYHCLASLVSHRVIKTKTGLSMAFAKIEDNTKIAEIVIFPGVYDKVKSLLINNNHFIVTIKATDRGYQALSMKEYKNE